jgi:beta-glucosidase
LGIPPLRLTDGPAGGARLNLRRRAGARGTGRDVFDDFAKEYGRAMARDGRARHQNVILGPMVNIVRVPQGGRNFETLGEDPWLTSQLCGSRGLRH